MDRLLSEKAVIDAINKMDSQKLYLPIEFKELLEQLPSAEPQIIRCKDCRYYKQFGKSEWGDCLALSRICKSIDFCSWGARTKTEQILSEAANDTAYGGLMSAT